MLQCLGKALEICPTHFDALEYLNLRLREKAKLEKDEKAEELSGSDSSRALSRPNPDLPFILSNLRIRSTDSHIRWPTNRVPDLRGYSRECRLGSLNPSHLSGVLIAYSPRQSGGCFGSASAYLLDSLKCLE